MNRRAVLTVLPLVAATAVPLALAAPAEPAGSTRQAVIVTGLDVRGAHAAVGDFGVRHRLPLIHGFSATLSAGQIRSLEHRPGVRVEPVTTVHVSDDGTSRDFGVNAARLDRPSLTGAGIGICVVDTGVDPNHEQIAPRTVTFHDFVGTSTTPYDDHGHGTHVSSIAAGDGTGGSSAATFAGVAPGASLYAAKVLDASGNGPNDQVVAGVQWCSAQPGVRVISMSLGDPEVVPDGLDALSQAVNAAAAAGDVVVVAAGNSGDLPGTINSPGAASGAVTVGAVSDYSNPVGTDRHDDGIYLAGFSSRGPTTDGRTKPDIAAPGVSVRAAQAGTASGYVTFSGTSMATPFVAGAVALGLQAAPAATPVQVKTALAQSALDVGAAGADNEYGAGYIDVRAFVDVLTSTATARHTAFPVHQVATGSVPNNGSTNVPIVIPSDGVGVPLAVTLVINGQPKCYYGCLIIEWSPDLDMQLLNPGGAVVADSRCALDGIECVTGRQETIGYQPTIAGTYTLHVWADTGSNNGGLGGTFRADISHGPVGTTAPPPPPVNTAPVANAGPDKTYVVRGKKTTASFSLDGSLSSDADGDPLTYGWTLGGVTVGSTAKVSQTKGIGTYTYLLTVSDGRGGTSSDSVVVTVRR
jgi:serine protease AprX